MIDRKLNKIYQMFIAIMQFLFVILHVPSKTNYKKSHPPDNKPLYYKEVVFLAHWRKVVDLLLQNKTANRSWPYLCLVRGDLLFPSTMRRLLYWCQLPECGMQKHNYITDNKGTTQGHLNIQPQQNNCSNALRKANQDHFSDRESIQTPFITEEPEWIPKCQTWYQPNKCKWQLIQRTSEEEDKKWSIIPSITLNILLNPEPRLRSRSWKRIGQEIREEPFSPRRSFTGEIVGGELGEWIERE